jgi:hypothetical protein
VQDWDKEAVEIEAIAEEEELIRVQQEVESFDKKKNPS